MRVTLSRLPPLAPSGAGDKDESEEQPLASCGPVVRGEQGRTTLGGYVLEWSSLLIPHASILHFNPSAFLHGTSDVGQFGLSPAVEETDDELMSEDSSAFGEEIMRHCDSLKSMAPVLSTINFVDLAGSERLSQASMTDDMDREKMRQKEVGAVAQSCLKCASASRSTAHCYEVTEINEPRLT